MDLRIIGYFTETRTELVLLDENGRYDDNYDYLDDYESGDCYKYEIIGTDTGDTYGEFDDFEEAKAELERLQEEYNEENEEDREAVPIISKPTTYSLPLKVKR